ncbi:MAG TPA: hypothetical protein DDW27_11110 [Bacteroidales bacterium]|nr:hypothetical protein [Bacteroidales bacterium]
MMEGNPVLYRADVITTKEMVYEKSKPWTATNVVNPVHDNLVQEGCGTFLEYLKWLGLAYEPDMLVLSSRHHFFYDQNDMRGVKVLVNLKKLNTIKHLDSFLHILFKVLSSDANFVGCFSDAKNHKRNGSKFFKTSFLYKRFIDFLDHKTERIMTRSNVEELLDSHGFRVVDMTEINGMTYFNTLNKRKAGE